MCGFVFVSGFNISSFDISYFGVSGFSVSSFDSLSAFIKSSLDLFLQSLIFQSCAINLSSSNDKFIILIYTKQKIFLYLMGENFFYIIMNFFIIIWVYVH